MSDFEDEPPSVLLPCAICSRTFRPEVLERHVRVCEKTATKKRRVYDSFKSRVSGTELEEFLGPAPLPGQAPRRPCKSPVKKRPPSKWKETHANLIATLRAARGVEPPPDTMLEASKPAGNEQCPSCSRHFGPRAFDRHVEFCREKTARIKLTPSKVSQAQERLEARTKYRAPLSIKPKLTTKEKYSPMLSRKESSENFLVSSSSTKTSPPIPTLSRSLKPVKQNSGGFSRQSPIRQSERQRSISPLKKNIVSSSKSSAKSEPQQKLLSQPKLKENLRSPEDLKPKTGSRASTQEKMRPCYPKLSLFEDETQRQLKKRKKKQREKPAPLQSDNESNEGTVDSERSEIRDPQTKPRGNKWSSAESLNKAKGKRKEKATEEKEKITLDLTGLEVAKMKAKDELKSGRKIRRQKQQINDLSVNDQSFGIFVAACTVRPPSSASRTCLKAAKESPKKKNIVKAEERQLSEKTEKKTMQHSVKEMVQNSSGILEHEQPKESVKTVKERRGSKVEKTSKIPTLGSKKPEKLKPVEVYPEIISYDEKSNAVPQENEETLTREEIKIKWKKWRNIIEIKTQELTHLADDFDLVGVDGGPQDLSESTIWEIAAEQFLHCGEPNQSSFSFSLDFLNENDGKKNFESDACKEISAKEEDLIVLHVTDPAKLIENDADMKLSVSEPCFPCSDIFQTLKDKILESKMVDITVFTASPNALQPRTTRRKRRKHRKTRKWVWPELSHIREKTFLANDLPKTKRQKMSNHSDWAPRFLDIGENFFPKGPSREELEEKKKRFIEGSKQQRQKIRIWQKTANSHMRFVKEFQESIEDDLKDFKSLSRGKKSRHALRELKREKMRMKNEQKKKTFGEDPKKEGKKFDYFEIDLTEKIDSNEPREADKKTNCANDRIEYFEKEEKSSSPPGGNSRNEGTSKKFESFEIANESPESKPKRVREKDRKKSDGRYSPKNIQEKTVDRSTPDSLQRISRQNSSLENIEEVDETAENEKSANASGNNIEIEDFILSKPDAKRILSQEENCLDELFPRPRKIAGAVTSAASKTAVRLGFTADSVYDLKSREEKKYNVLPPTPRRSNSTRILEKRMKKAGELPQIIVKNRELKENSMMSLIESWKCKKGNSDGEKLYKAKGTLPSGKLPPLTNKNSFQIGADSNESYDPFKQAERQMLALLSWPSAADIKTANSMSPTPKPKPTPQHTSNLETSPSSAFTKYPNKDDKPVKKGKTNARRNLNETFAMNEKNSPNDKPTYTAADDWEQIFEKHFDLNRNEMTEQMTKSVKSALDGLLKTTVKNRSNLTDEEFSPQKGKNEMTQNSFITNVLYTSTPKHNSKAERNSKTRIKDPTVDLDKTPTTYRKNSEFTFDSITPPEDFTDSSKEKKPDKGNRNSGISLSSLSFSSQISDTTLADEEVMRSNLEIIGKAAVASRTPRRKYARSQSVFDERNKMLFAKTYDPNCTSSDENDVDVLPKIVDKQGKVSPPCNPNHKPTPSHFYRSQSAVDDRCKGDGYHSEDAEHVSSPESNRNRKTKMSGDSAYSSLNRRSPRQSNQRNRNEDRLSSSGSEHSLPTVSDFEAKPKFPDFETAPSKKEKPVKMSKFCHECGSKYPVAVAKFCCECGVRRLVI